jgi:hypothetical protein
MVKPSRSVRCSDAPGPKRLLHRGPYVANKAQRFNDCRITDDDANEQATKFCKSIHQFPVSKYGLGHAGWNDSSNQRRRR